MMTRMLAGMLGSLLVASAWAAPHQAEVPTSVVVGQVVKALCSKDVVMLGEDNHHGSGRTLDLKVKLVKRLVRQCGFRGVVFESQFYDMLDFEHSVADGTASQRQLSDAIGAVWSRYPRFRSLAGWLFRQARAGRIRIGGMDPQVGGITDLYSQQRLPTVLASVLAGARRRQCASAIKRHDNWEYDGAHPFDTAVLDRLRGCLDDIRGRLRSSGRRAPPPLRAMADSYSAYLDFVDAKDEGTRRDRAMYRNFAWLRRHWPKGTRIVVWCATAHAAKSSNGWDATFRPFGNHVHARFGSRAAAIGFSALGGTYGNVGGHGKPHAIPPARAGSLEARAFAGPGPHAMRFVDRAQLKAMGQVPSRAINYARPYTLHWSRILDGVIVLRREVADRAKS